MPDTMTLTKIVGSLCGALLVFLLGNWAGEALYSVGGGYGEEQQAYVIDTGEAGEKTADAAPDEPSFAAAYGSADAGAGEALFNQCVACHKIKEETNGVGPHLAGVVGRGIASVEGYSYTDALTGLEGAWTPEELDPWLKNPADYAPGTKMGFAGIGDIQERANLIAYLHSFEGDPAMAPSAYADQGAAETAAAPADSAETAADGAAPAEGDEAAAAGGNDASGAGGDFAAMVAAADPADGKTLFARCAACHSLEPGQNGVGPSLHGVVGREIASAEGFSYSNAIKGLEGAWTPAKLKEWIANPMQVAPGTRMPPAGVTDDKDLAAVIAYLRTQAPEDSASAAESDASDTAPADDAAAPEKTAEAAGTGDTGETGGATGDAENGFAAKVAAADPADGKTLFARCAACHAVEPGVNRVGPSLHGVVGSEIAAGEGFNYSNAIKGLEGAWTPAKLKEWIANPMQVAPGTRMPPAGVTAEDDLAALIAYLDSLDE